MFAVNVKAPVALAPAMVEWGGRQPRFVDRAARRAERDRLLGEQGRGRDDDGDVGGGVRADDAAFVHGITLDVDGGRRHVAVLAG